MNTEGENRKIKTFKDLNAWQESHKLVLMVYKLTRTFPREELFGLTSQIRRCAVSITSNIAEGFSRNTYKDKIQFYCISLGSLTEFQNQVLIARDIEYINDENFNKIEEQSIIAHKLINGLIKSSKKYLSS